MHTRAIWEGEGTQFRTGPARPLVRPPNPAYHCPATYSAPRWGSWPALQSAVRRRQRTCRLVSRPGTADRSGRYVWSSQSS